MRKNLGANPYVYPQPVLIVASYGEDGTADAMNVAYGGIVNSNRIQINIGVRHKTSDNIKLRNAFTVGIADEKNLVAADYVGIVSGHDVPDKLNGISYDPANRTYLRVGRKAGTAFSDGNRLK